MAKKITEYIFKPAMRTETEDHNLTNERADEARDRIAAAKEIQFVMDPSVGTRAIFNVRDQDGASGTIATSTVREMVFDEEAGFIRLKTRNSVYVFELAETA